MAKTDRVFATAGTPAFLHFEPRACEKTSKSKASSQAISAFFELVEAQVRVVCRPPFRTKMLT